MNEKLFCCIPPSGKKSVSTKCNTLTKSETHQYLPDPSVVPPTPRNKSLEKCCYLGTVLVVFDYTKRKIDNFFVRISGFHTVSRLKYEIKKKIEFDRNNEELSLYHKNVRMTDEEILFNYGIKLKSTVLADVRNKSKRRKSTIDFFGNGPRNEDIKVLMEEVLQGLKAGYTPELTMDGTGGTYFMKNKDKMNCAIFKPFNEEPFAPENPRLYKAELGSRSFRPGLVSGGGASREVAAYLLDTGGFSGVPPTTLVEINNCKVLDPLKVSKKTNVQKIGSLQKIVAHEDSAVNFGTKRFDVDEVHKVGILDIHIVNLDRNDENILVNFKKDGKLDFVPIDHGFSLPNCLAVEMYDWVWLSWPQSRSPFSEKSLEYISAINLERDAETLRNIGIDEECIIVFKIVNLLLKKGAEAGLTLFQIAKIMLRDDKETPSQLERIVVHAMMLMIEELRSNRGSIQQSSDESESSNYTTSLTTSESRSEESSADTSASGEHTDSEVAADPQKHEKTACAVRGVTAIRSEHVFRAHNITAEKSFSSTDEWNAENDEKNPHDLGDNTGKENAREAAKELKESDKRANAEFKRKSYPTSFMVIEERVFDKAEMPDGEKDQRDESRPKDTKDQRLIVIESRRGKAEQLQSPKASSPKQARHRKKGKSVKKTKGESGSVPEIPPKRKLARSRSAALIESQFSKFGRSEDGFLAAKHILFPRQNWQARVDIEISARSEKELWMRWYCELLRNESFLLRVSSLLDITVQRLALRNQSARIEQNA